MSIHVPTAESEKPALSGKPARPHLDFLDGLRAVAMLTVLFNHIYNEAFWHRGHFDIGQTPHWFWHLLHGLTLGHYAVDVFIVLSGFCLALPVVLSKGELRGGATQFYLRRARRILPPYFISMLVAFLVSSLSHHLGADPAPTITEFGVLTHLLLIHDLFITTIRQINPVLWSVAVEWRIYFLFPLLVWGWKKIGATLTTLIFVVFSLVLFKFMSHFGWNVLSSMGTGASPHYIGLFAMGTLGAVVAFSKDTEFLKDAALTRACAFIGSPWAVLVLTMIALVVINTQTRLEIQDMVIGFWAMCVMARAGQNPHFWAFRFLSARFLVVLGTFAYSTYLTHEPILTLVRQIIMRVRPLPPFSLFLTEAFVGGAAAIGFSYLFHLAFERPFMSKPGTKIKSERQAEVAAVVGPAP